MNIQYENKAKEDWFLISWALSNKCNYRCSYCPDFLHNGSSGHPNWDTVSKFINNFNPVSKKLCYRITGGEPTFWKKFIDMAKLIKENGHSFSFITNGSQSVDYYKSIDQFTDGMIISYHPEYADIDHFIDIANNMQCEVAINLMIPHNTEEFSKSVNVAKKLFDNTDRLAIWPKVILDKTTGEHITNELTDYTQEQLHIIQNWPYFRKLNDENLHRGNILYDGEPTDANQLITKGLNRHKGWTCWAGLDMIYIEWGKIYRAECFQGGPIGTLDHFEMPSTTVTCNKDICSCLSDIYLRKFMP